jgi:hypothetical protein
MEEQLDPNTISTIFSLLPNKTLETLIEVLPTDMYSVSQNPLFWKGLTETLLKKHLNIRNIDWKDTYWKLSQAIKHSQSPYVDIVKHDKNASRFLGIITTSILKRLLSY